MKKKEQRMKENKKKTKENSKKLPYDSNITSDDKQALHEKNLSMDQGQDKPLAERKRPVDFTGEELDIPRRDDSDTTQEGTDLPDEENLQFDERGIPLKGKKRREHPGPEDIPITDKE